MCVICDIKINPITDRIKRPYKKRMGTSHTSHTHIHSTEYNNNIIINIIIIICIKIKS